MPRIITLRQAMEDAPGCVQGLRRRIDPAVLQQALDHHTQRGLSADLTAGTTQDCDGERSRFEDYDLEWSKEYEGAPHHIFFDFFERAISNSASRLSRGLPA